MEDFNAALASGATPQEAFDSVAQAHMDAAIEQGVPIEEIEATTETARTAFNEALDSGASPEEAMMAANEAVDAAEVVAVIAVVATGAAADVGTKVISSTYERLSLSYYNDKGPVNHRAFFLYLDTEVRTKLG